MGLSWQFIALTMAIIIGMQGRAYFGQFPELVSSDFKEDVSKEVDLELKEAIDFADKSSFPSNDTLYQDVYA